LDRATTLLDDKTIVIANKIMIGKDTTAKKTARVVATRTGKANALRFNLTLATALKWVPSPS